MGVFNDIGDFFSGVGKSIVNPAKDIVNNGFNAISGTGNKILNGVGSAGDKILDGVGNAGGKIIDLGGKVIDKVGDIIDKTTDFLTSPLTLITLAIGGVMVIYLISSTKK